MRKVFVADKYSYGAEFFVECNSLKIGRAHV